MTRRTLVPRKCCITLALFAVATLSHAQSVPPLINYQGRAEDAAGNEISGMHRLEFNIYDASSGGTHNWGPQVYANAVVMDGYFSVILGPTDASGRSILSTFTNETQWIGLRIDDAQEQSPRQRIISTPYAAVARAVRGPGLHVNHTHTAVGVGTQTPGRRLHVGGAGAEFLLENLHAPDNRRRFNIYIPNDGTTHFRALNDAGTNGVELLRFDNTTGDAHFGGTISAGGLSAALKAEVVPVGAIQAYFLNAEPEGWLFCDGRLLTDSTLSSSKYAQLKTRLTAEGHSTLPDLRGVFLRGRDSFATARGARGMDPDGTRTNGHYQGDDFGEHHHDIRAEGGGLGSWVNYDGINLNGDGPNAPVVYAGGDGSLGVQDEGGLETRPKNVAVNYIIKH